MSVHKCPIWKPKKIIQWIQRKDGNSEFRRAKLFTFRHDELSNIRRLIRSLIESWSSQNVIRTVGNRRTVSNWRILNPPEPVFYLHLKDLRETRIFLILNLCDWKSYWPSQIGRNLPASKATKRACLHLSPGISIQFLWNEFLYSYHLLV